VIHVHKILVSMVVNVHRMVMEDLYVVVHNHILVNDVKIV